jgi:2-dehydropantoate 2-reductase
VSDRERVRRKARGCHAPEDGFAERVSTTFSKIAIVGSGALGCYYGARLARAGGEVHFLMRSDREVVRERGLRIQTPTENFVLEQVITAGTAAEIGVSDLVIVALKTTANAHLDALVRPLVGERTAILTLQNGLGSDEELARLFGAERVLGGLCFICVNRVAPGEIACLHPGSVALGEFGRPAGERAKALAELFGRAGVRCHPGDDLAALRWKKLVWNIPFNGLSIAAGGITTDRILAEPELEGLVRGLMAEVIGAAARFGYTIPAAFIDRQIDETRPMGAYKPSSLVDYLAGREVEVESIWGEPLRRARQRGAEMPRLEMLYALIKALAPRAKA